MFVLFHENLVHSSAASILENIPFAMNYASDCRAFAYIDKFGNENKGKQKCQGNEVEKRGTHEDGVTTTTFTCCDKMKVKTLPCQICDEHENIFTTNDSFLWILVRQYMRHTWEKENLNLNIWSPSLVI